MLTDPTTFYVRHRAQISEWAALKERVDRSIRDAVTEGSPETAIKIAAGESGDAEVDFYVRNRALITEWDALQTSAGAALHGALLTAARAAGLIADEAKRGWTSVHVDTPELIALRAERGAWTEMVWMRQDLLSTRRGYPFPRMAVVLEPSRWMIEERATVVTATRIVAHELGMTKRGDTWWAHWDLLDTNSPLVVENIELDPRFAANGFFDLEHCRFYAGTPVHAPDGTTVGSLCLLDAFPKSASRIDIEDLKAFALEAETAICELVAARARGAVDAKRDRASA